MYVLLYFGGGLKFFGASLNLRGDVHDGPRLRGKLGNKEPYPGSSWILRSQTRVTNKQCYVAGTDAGACFDIKNENSVYELLF